MLPPEAGNYDDSPRSRARWSTAALPRTGGGRRGQSPIVYCDLEEREEKTVLGDADGFELSADGKKLLVAARRTATRSSTSSPTRSWRRRSPPATWSMTVDPAAEWRQIFTDAWRLRARLLLRPEHARRRLGRDARALRRAARRRGHPLGRQLRHRRDDRRAERLARLPRRRRRRAGPQRRASACSGSTSSSRTAPTASQRILDGAPWDSEVRSPLRQPGVDVKEGDYLLAVNGVPLDVTKDPWAAFQGLAEKTVQLTVNDKPDDEGRARGPGRDAGERGPAAQPGLDRARTAARSTRPPAAASATSTCPTPASTARPSWCASSTASATRTA